MDVSTKIALIALTFSLVSPIISSCINGYYDMKRIDKENERRAEEHKQNFYIQHRAEVIESFIRNMGKCLQYSNEENFIDFSASSGEIYLYVDKSLWPMIDTVIEKARQNAQEEGLKVFYSLCKALSSTDVRTKE